MKDVHVNATAILKVYVNPISVLQEINIIPRRDWIIQKDGKYIQMTEESAGQHSFDDEVGEVSKEMYDIWKARDLLIEYLEKR